MLVMFLVGNPPKRQLQKDARGSSNNAACLEPGRFGDARPIGHCSFRKNESKSSPWSLGFHRKYLKMPGK